MVILSFRTGTYARNIYLYGNTSFAVIPIEYHQPVKEYAAANFTDDQINQALSNGWITETEYNDTMSIKYPTQIETP